MIAWREANALWPMLLWSLALLPVAAYWLLRARRDWVCPALHLLALGCLMVAMARPQVPLAVPVRADALMLAIDISGSMRADDLKPDRLTVALQAAGRFIDEQPSAVRVGIVSVAGTAAIVQSPTRNREELHRALERLQLQRGTALGSGLVLALATLLPEAQIDVEAFITGQSRRSDPAQGTAEGATPPPEQEPVEPGSRDSLAIVLISDGQSNTGPDVLKAAELAARHGVRVHTIGVGSRDGAIVTTKGWSMRVRLDEEPLRKIARMSAGEFFRADSPEAFGEVYRQIAARLALRRQERTELTGALTALGALLAAIASLLSIARTGRII